MRLPKIQSGSGSSRAAHTYAAAHNESSARLLKRLLREESGQDLIEYALILGLVGLGAIASMKSVSTGLAKVFGTIGTTLTSAT